MSARIFIVLFLFTLVFYAADTPQMLEKKLASAPKEEKVKILNEIAFAYRKISPEKTREYGGKALQLARQLSDKDEEAKALKNMGLSYFLVGEYEKTLEFYFQAQNIFKEAREERGIAVIKASIGNVAWSLGDFENAMKYYREALDIFRERDEKRNTASLINNMGNIYLQWGKYANALEAYLESLEIKKTLKEKNYYGMALTLSNIGLIYRELEDADRALEFHQKALEIMKKLDSKKGISLCMNNIGLVYLKKKILDRALEYFEKSLQLKEEIKDNPGISEVLGSIGDVWRAKGEKNRALDYYNRSLAIRETLKDNAALAEIHKDIGSIHKEMGDYEKGVLYLEKSLSLSKQTQTREILRETLSLLSEIYSIRGDKTKSWEYHAQSLLVKDEMFNKVTNKRIRELQIKYETGQIKTRFDMQKKRLTLYITAAVVLFIFTVIGLYFVVRSRRSIISKTDALLQRKDMEIDYRVRQIEEINVELKTLKKEKKKKKYKGSRLTTTQSKAYLSRLIRFMEQEKPFLEEDLTLKDLAERTGIPLRDLSRIVNEKLHKNFNDFINFYRVEEAKQLLLLQGEKEMSILDIAFEVGFNSKSSFNSIFKKQTGMTPSLFKKKGDKGLRIASAG